MKRKTTLKKPAPGKSKGAGEAEKTVAKQFRKYLSAKFTHKLTQHMHRAKKAALDGKE